jgi:hypothetical protein
MQSEAAERIDVKTDRLSAGGGAAGGGPPDNAGEFIGRSAFRLDEDPPTYSDHHIGFRIVSTD